MARFLVECNSGDIHMRTKWWSTQYIKNELPVLKEFKVKYVFAIDVHFSGAVPANDNICDTVFPHSYKFD